jgi:uncharacterized protein YceH (UPF0502 family)
VLLSPEEGRVIGSLIEKQLTTPQQYPLTLNALILACNQSSNRDPVVVYDERTVDSAVTSLKSGGVLRFVHPSHGRSVTRYRQVLEERLDLTETQLALIGILLLRGPQTAGELRARTERMARFEGIAHVDTDLQRLSEGPEPLTMRLARRPGQKEERWIQLLTDGDVDAPDTPRAPEADPAVRAEPSTDGSTLVGRLTSVEKEIADLRTQVESLRADLDHLRTQLGS